MARLGWLGFAVVLTLVLASCGVPGSTGACRRDPATYMLECQPGFTGAGGPIVTAALALIAFAFKGCTINGCELPNHCNPQTKRCEPIPCRETRSCPSGYRCDFSTQLCR